MAVSPVWYLSGTPLDHLDYVMDKVDMIGDVGESGFWCQRFIPSALDKLREVRKRIDASGCDIR